MCRPGEGAGDDEGEKGAAARSGVGVWAVGVLVVMAYLAV